MPQVFLKNESKNFADRKSCSAPKSRTPSTPTGLQSASRTTSSQLKKLPPIKNGIATQKPPSRADSADCESEIGTPTTTQDVLKLCQESDCLKVLNIDLHGYKLRKICDLTKFTRIQGLDLSGNFLSKIEGLDANQLLKTLKLYDNRISTVHNLDCLTQLQDLQLQFNAIESVGTGFSALRNLTSLRLDNNKLTAISVQEFSPVSKTLQILDISRNQLTDISAIISLKALEELNVSGNAIKSLPCLKNLGKLVEFDCSENLLTTLRGLESCGSLTTLIAARNKLRSDLFTQFQGYLDQLDRLDVEENKIVEVEGIARAFPNISILNVAKNEIRDFSPLLSSLLERLAEIDSRDNPVSLDSTRFKEAFPTVEMVDGRPARGTCVLMPKDPLNIHPVGMSANYRCCLLTSHVLPTPIKKKL